MRVEVTGRHVNITPPLRQLIDPPADEAGASPQRQRHLGTQVILSKEKYRHRRRRSSSTSRGDHMLRGQGEGTSWPVAVRDAVAKIEQQAQTLKGKWGDRRRRGARARSTVTAPAAPEPSRAPRIVRATRYAVKPMSVDDAALRMESGAETFVVFRNADNDAVSILVPPHRWQLRVD